MGKSEPPAPSEPAVHKGDLRDTAPKAAKGTRWWLDRIALAAACALVMGVYAYAAHSSFLFPASLDSAGERYNLMVQGFRAAQLNLKMAVPPELLAAANPYDPTTSSHSPALDMSFYKGKLYLYYGVTPVLVLFWPYVKVTGHYLSQKNAAVIFCVAGFLASAGWLFSVWRRYFAGIGAGTVAAVAIALGLVTGMPSLLARCDVYEVCISCGYAFTMLALAATWKALHERAHQGRWLAAASLSYGLAVAARPSLLFGAVILIVPVALAWRERRKTWRLVLAAIVPITLIGLGLMLYNALRFDNPFEFGLRYTLSGDRSSTIQPFTPRYLWFHFRVYFLQPMGWISRFPFVREIPVARVPSGHGQVEHPFGVLANIPVVWLALAAPLAWRGRSKPVRSILRGYLAAVAFLFGASVLTLSLYFSASIRYEVEFLPALVLLAAIGILSVERTLSDRPSWRRTVRWGWALLLAFSVAFSLLVSTVRCAESHCNLAYALERMGRMPEAITQYEQALRLDPDYAEAHRLLGNRLFEAGKVPEAISQYRETVRLSPGGAESYNNLGVALSREGKLSEAAEQFRHALLINPRSAEGHSNLAVVLAQLGNTSEALEHFEQSLQSRPDDAETHYEFALALERAGLSEEAKHQYEQVLHLQPDFTDAQTRLDQLNKAR